MDIDSIIKQEMEKAEEQNGIDKDEEVKMVEENTTKHEVQEKEFPDKSKVQFEPEIEQPTKSLFDFKTMPTFKSASLGNRDQKVPDIFP